MKRCPECGFRADDMICPLCGVRMRESDTPAQTHSHTQAGERCVLPNRERPDVGQETQQQVYRPQSSRKRTGGTPSGFVITVAVIILISMLRSCVGIY